MTGVGTATTIQHPIGSNGLFVLRLRDGDLRLIGGDRDDVRVHSSDRALLGRVAVERGERNLSVRADGRAGLTVELPSGATIVIDGTSADIDATGLTGDQRYRTASGDLAIHDGGGALSVEAVSGDVDIATTKPATLKVRTVSGDLSIRAAGILGLRAATTSGDVRLAGCFEGPGPFSVESVSGDTILAPAGGIRIEVRTIAGDIRHARDARLEEVDGLRTLVVGGDGPTIAFRSLSGDLRVVGPAAADGPSPAESDPLAREELAILQALERGEIDVAEAERRLAAPGAGEPEAAAPEPDR
jgi:DUF4097 and DUF4098 domain-containing protein YvlB